MPINISNTPVYQGAIEPVLNTQTDGVNRNESFATLADFTAAGGAAGYGVGPLWIAGAQYWSDGSSISATGGGSGVINKRSTVALVGDSFIVRDTQSFSGGYQQVSGKSIFEWINIRLGKRFDPIYWDGVNGTRIDQFIPRLGNAIGANPDYIWIQGSVNNFGTTSLSYSDQVNYFTQAIQMVLAAGIIPIVTTIPVSTNVNTPAEYLVWQQINEWIRKEAASMGAIICDYAYGISDPESITGQPILSLTDTSDGVHRSFSSAIIDSYYGHLSLKDKIPAWNIPWLDVYDASQPNTRVGLFKNPRNAGSGGAGDATGTIPANMAIFKPGAGSAVASKIARTDAPGFWVQTACDTTGAAAAANCQTSYTNTGSLGGKVAGDSIEVFQEFELDIANLDALRGIQFRIYFYGATTERSYEFVDTATVAYALVGNYTGESKITGVVSTPRRTIPAGATGLNVSFDMVVQTPGKVINLRLGRQTFL